MDVRKLNRVCVYCGSKAGKRESYACAAQELGSELARRNIGLIYGGGSVGLMGGIARAADREGGSVLGIIPEALMPREISGESVGEILAVGDMHERKARMAAEADGFIAMPGGFGTLEELLEMITWSQLGIHSKPVGLLNVEGFYDSLLSFFDHCVEEGFVTPESRSIVICEPTVTELLDRLQDYRPLHKGVNTTESWQLGKLGYSASAIGK